MRSPVVPLALGILAGSAFGQAPPDANLSFEVASVRTSAGGTPGPAREGTFDGQQVTFRDAQLIQIIRVAYGVDFDRISGPGWLYDEKFDIAAKVPPGTTQEQSNAMLRNLLAERFRLALHHVSKQFSAYGLTIAKGGSKLKETADATAQPMRPGAAPRDDPSRNVKTTPDGFPEIPAGTSGMRGSSVNGVMYLTFRAMPMDALTFQLAAGLGAVTGTNRYAMGHIVDNTGLTGKYDFTLRFAGRLGPGGMDNAPSVDGGADPAPDIFEALEKQLGLKLTRSTNWEDTLVIDHIEKIPTEN